MENEKCQFSVESFLKGWNMDFPQYNLKAEDLKKPHALMEALLMMFNRLGIDKDIVFAPPENINESVQYYWDLLPIINMTRIVNHLLHVRPEVMNPISIMHFLQPTPSSSRSILMLLLNLSLFNEERMVEIAPMEAELHAKTEHVKTLESRKNQLLEMLNKQAEEKGKLAERLEKLRPDVRQLEEELKQEKEVHNEEKQQLEPLLKENSEAQLLLEQKTSHRDALLAEVARKKALRVYDADDIKARAEQAAQNLKEAEEKMNTLNETLIQKENSLENLKTTKPSLETANNFLNEIMTLSDSLKDFESGDLDSDSKEGELDMLNTELSELRVQLGELQAARAKAAERHEESRAKRQVDKSQALRALREAEERDKKCRERCKRAAQRTDEIQHNTIQYEEERSAGMKELADIKDNFCNNLKSVEGMLIEKTLEVEKRFEEKLQNRNL